MKIFSFFLISECLLSNFFFISKLFFFFISFDFYFYFLFNCLFNFLYNFLSILYSIFVGTPGSMNVPRTWKILAKENYLDEWVPLLDHNKVEHSRENNVFESLKRKRKIVLFLFFTYFISFNFRFFLLFYFFRVFYLFIFLFYFRIPLWKMYRGLLQNGRWPFPIRI